jgi:[lysine-biosynthesis-protein LysW]---L-2-aminoadipate ligase
LRFAVVAQRSTPTNLALASCVVPGVESLLLTPAQALARLGPGDVALGRLDVLHSLDGIEPGAWAFEALAARGCRLLNRRDAILAAHDKRRTAKALADAGLPHPATQIVRSPTTEVDLEPPFVVKPPFGSWGEDVVLCADRAVLSTCLHALCDRPWFGATGAVVQELVPPIGHDLRLVVAGRRVVGAIERVAPAGEWRTNVALGGIRRPVVPPPRACELGVAAATALGIDLAGIDLLPVGAGEYVVLELNAAVEFTPEYAAEDAYAAAVSALLSDSPDVAPEDEAATADLVV